MLGLYSMPMHIDGITKDSLGDISCSKGIVQNYTNASGMETFETNLVFFSNEIVQIPFLIDCHIQLLAVIL